VARFARSSRRAAANNGRAARSTQSPKPPESRATAPRNLSHATEKEQARDLIDCGLVRKQPLRSIQLRVACSVLRADAALAATGAAFSGATSGTFACRSRGCIRANPLLHEIAHEIDAAVRVAPLVVVPAHELEELAVQLDAAAGVEDRAVRIVDEVVETTSSEV
jgi:hypothetical protein